MLGPLEVVGDDGPVVLARPRERCILASLALEPNRVVSVDRLVEQAWDGEPPRTAENGLKVAVSRLRQMLGPDGPKHIQTQPPGYLLVAAPAETDSGAFLRLADRGRAAFAAGDAAGAADILRGALALWRGPVLADMADRSFVQVAAVGLEEARLSTIEDRIDADLACGRARELVAELEDLVQQHPLRERLWHHYLLALYRSDRQGDALRAYERVRVLLADELGIDPGPELRALERDILGHAPSLDFVAGDAPVARHNLPPERGPFIGRSDEAEALSAAIRAERVVTVTGAAGIGKSRLARRCGTDLLDEFPGGVWLADLSALPDTAGPDDVAALIGIEPTAPYLVLLDNCDTAIDGAALFVHRLVDRAPHATIVATCCQPMRIRGELVVRIGPLPLPDCVALFTERMRRTNPSLEVTPELTTTIEQICSHLDGHPLAIGLAASRTRLLGPTAILDRLDDWFGLLVGGDRSTIAHHKTLVSLLEWNIGLLADDEKALLTRMAAHDDDLALDVIEATCGGDPIAEGGVLTALEALIDRGLVEPVGGGYHLLRPVRDYARR